MSRWVFGILSLILTAIATTFAFAVAELASEPRFGHPFSLWPLVASDLAMFAGAVLLFWLALRAAARSARN
jgi:hypothetical protein